MSSRSYVLALLLSSVALAGVGLAACTTETTVVQGGGDAATDAPREVSGPKDSGGTTDEDTSQTQDECFAACEKQFAAGLTKDKAIDNCWTQKCDDPCNGTGGFDAGSGIDGGDGGDAGDDAEGGTVDAGPPACMN